MSINDFPARPLNLWMSWVVYFSCGITLIHLALRVSGLSENYLLIRECNYSRENGL